MEKIKQELFQKDQSGKRYLSGMVLLLALIFGFMVRWNFISGAEYPINDGGLFYTQIEDLVNNNFRMSEVSSYNLADIPNSYPPLAFYIVGLINLICGVSVMQLLLYLPFIISVLTIPVFYGITRIFFPKDQFARALAVFIFATLPRSFEWFVMGGGITRALGFLFAISAIIFYAKGLTREKIGADLILSGIFCSLTVLTHPVAGLFLAFSMLVITIYFWPLNILYPLVISGITLVGSSPWWLTVILRNGFAPFIGAGNTGHAEWIDFGYLLTLNFKFENQYFLSLVSILALVGLFSSQRRKSLFLGILVGLGYILIPRGGVDLLTSYLAILATLGFTTLDEAWDKHEEGDSRTNRKRIWPCKRTRIFLLFLIVYLFIGAYTYKFIDGKADLHLTADEYQAMIWIRDKTGKDAILMHLPPNSSYQDWWNDYIGEWLPAIARRHSLATVQGYEWVPGSFIERVEKYGALRKCTTQGVACVENWLINYDHRVNYLLLSKRQHPLIILDDFRKSNELKTVFNNADVMIFERLDD
jgi:hypothetical protein